MLGSMPCPALKNGCNSAGFIFESSGVDRMSCLFPLRAALKRLALGMAFYLIIIFPLSAQTLFTYGSHAVSKSEFLKAYNKNSGDSNNPKMSYTDYLDLYAKFRMKVQSALDEKLDTTQQQHSEEQAFRNQLAEGYLKEDASVKLLVEEAAARSFKDIHLTCIYVALKPGPTADEISDADTKIKEAYNKLKNGSSFDNVGSEYSYADLGFVTAFVLPYEIENIAYTTPVGGYARPYQGTKGFYIFRPTEERRAIGKVRVAQILLAFPPNADEQVKKSILRRADSVYDALRSGADFGSLAKEVSNDNLSYETGGQLPVFGVGQYDPVFEKAAFALARDGNISMPFETSFGYHILLRVQRIPVVEDVDNKEWNSLIKERVEQSDRMKVAQQKLLRNIRDRIKNDAPSETQTSDTAALEYYRQHLEKYNVDFAGQLTEFKEGNLLFNVMQKNVWDAASADSAALLKYYNDNKSRYWWENSADALIITCQDRKQASKVQEAVKSDLLHWRRWPEISNGTIQVDSGRYELGQIPVAGRTNFTEGLITAPVSGTQDSSATFAYIIRLYKEREPKKFNDAKGAVINDYQAALESKWMVALRQKYPVKINKKVFKSLP